MARSDDLSLCGKATQMADELSRGLAAACHLHAAACLGPPCRSLVNGSPRADALLSMPREPPGLLLCLPSLWPWPLRLCETALRCSSSLALCKHDRGLFQNLIEKLSPVTLQGGRPASYTRQGVKPGPYKVDGRALVSCRRLPRRNLSASSWQRVAKGHRPGRWAKLCRKRSSRSLEEPPRRGKEANF